MEKKINPGEIPFVSLCLRGLACDGVALRLGAMCGGRDCLSQGGQETEGGYRKRPGQPIVPKNKPLCDLLPLGRPHLLNFLQPSKIMPPARYWKFRTRDGERQWPVKFKVKRGQKMIARNMFLPNHYF